MTRVAATALDDFCRRALAAAGLQGDHAGAVAACLVDANLWGIESHGVSRLPIYCERLRRGVVNTRPALSLHGARAAATLDGDNAPGAVVGIRAMDEAIGRAKSYGIGIVVARRSNHYGVAAHYTRRAVAQGCVGISGCNAPVGMAVWGSSEPALGTNPFAVAAPAGRYGTFSLDMSSSVAARGRISVAQRKSEPIPPGWALDAAGRPTTDADAAWAGVVLPFAGAKGSGFALFIEIIAGALAGAAMAGEIGDLYGEFEQPQASGQFFVAIEIESFMTMPRFVERVESLVTEIKGRRKAEGVVEILMPGEIEARRESQQRGEGIELDEGVLARLRALAEAADIAPLATLDGAEGKTT